MPVMKNGANEPSRDSRCRFGLKCQVIYYPAAIGGWHYSSVMPPQIHRAHGGLLNKPFAFSHLDEGEIRVADWEKLE